jgi:EAL domain-containing protein (putative c-di-GMP-specific phosphodiesterase class I)
MLDDPVDYAMVESINQLGHVMSMRTIAEYAESEAILACLRRLGVDYAQGQAVGEVRPLDELLG